MAQLTLFDEARGKAAQLAMYCSCSRETMLTRTLWAASYAVRVNEDCFGETCAGILESDDHGRSVATRLPGKKTRTFYYREPS